MKSSFIKLIDGYEKTRLGRHFLSFSYSGSSKNRKTKNAFLHKAGESVSSFFAATRSTCYGAFFISFGLAVLLFYFFNDFTGAYEGKNISTIILGVVCSLISVPLLLIDKPSHRLISESRVLDYIFFEFLCMKRGWSPEGRRGAPTLLGVIFGILLAALGILVPVGRVALFGGVAVLVYLSFSSPEFPYLLSLFLVPYSACIPNASVALSVLALLSFASFFVKTVSGKRVINIEQYDVLLLVMLTLVCVLSVLSTGEIKISDLLVVFSLFAGYSMASNVIINRRLADTVSSGIVIATLPISLLSAVARIISLATGATHAAPSVPLAMSIVLSAILTIRLIKHATGAVKVFYFALLAVYVFLALFLLSPIYIIAMALGFLTTALYRIGKYFSLPVVAICLVISLLHLLPEEVRLPMLELLEIKAPTLVEKLLSGGVGWALLAVVLLLLAIRVRHRIVYSAFFEGTHLTSISVGYAGGAVALLLIIASSVYMLSDFSFYLLISVFGMGSAALRVAKSENDNAELYFEDSKDTDSSTVNIVIR